jgi:hypothetical protein
MSIPQSVLERYFDDPDGDLRIFRAPAYNHIGNSFFTNLFKSLVPLFRTKVLPYVGRRALEAGADIVHSLTEGDNLKSALKTGAKRTLERGRQDLVRSLSGGKSKREKKTTNQTLRHKLSKYKKQRQARNPSVYRDYFTVR